MTILNSLIKYMDWIKAYSPDNAMSMVGEIQVSQKNVLWYFNKPTESEIDWPENNIKHHDVNDSNTSSALL